jgi:hypothetical protein
MRALHHMLPAILAAGIAVTGLAGEAEGGSGSGRVLLQPPPDLIASPISDRFALRALYFGPAIDNRLRYDNSFGVPGTTFDAEDTLGQKRQDHAGTIDMMFRIGERHRIEADFFQLRRNGDVILAGDVAFGDDVYLAGERLVSEMELRKLGIVYTYSIFKRERFEIGAGLALHLVQLQGSTAVPARFEDEILDTAGPFAALVVQGTWRISRRFSLNVSGQYFDLSPDDVRGSYRGFEGNVQYRGWRNLAFGLGYKYSGYLVDSTDPDFSGFYRLVYQGPEAFLRVSF